jgi:hypothetical protein
MSNLSTGSVKKAASIGEEDIQSFVARSMDCVGPISGTMQQIRNMQDQVDIFNNLLLSLKNRLHPVTIPPITAEAGIDSTDKQLPYTSSSPVAREIESTVRAQKLLNSELRDLLSMLEI